MGRMFAASILALLAIAVARGQDEKNVYRPPPAPPTPPAQHSSPLPAAAIRPVPFFATDYTILDTEVGTANTAIVQDTQHVVEPDNKWVAYSTAGTPDAGIGLDVLQEFSYDRLPPMGYAGTPLPTAPSPPQGRESVRGTAGDRGRKPTTRPVAEPVGVLAQQGTVKLLDLTPAVQSPKAP